MDEQQRDLRAAIATRRELGADVEDDLVVRFLAKIEAKAAEMARPDVKPPLPPWALAAALAACAPALIGGAYFAGPLGLIVAGLTLSGIAKAHLRHYRV